MAYRCFMICLVLSLCISPSLSADDVFLSIDCGSSLSYKDQRGIDWVGDDKYVQNGESRSVTPSNTYNHVVDTLRVFTTGSKNCYHIDSVKKGRVLVRAYFYYGDYDGKSSPPTFALFFDGNYWASSVTTSITEFYFYDVIYVMKKDYISVCVALTEPGQFPFISAITVRSLEPYMYNHIDDIYPLFSWKTIAFGSNTTIRYPDDLYDRVWFPGYPSKGSICVSSDALFSEAVSADDQPPPAVLKNAITAARSNASLELLIPELLSYDVPVYINWYFSEITRLGPNQNRSFRIFKDNKSFSDPISPLYDDCTQMYTSNTTLSSKTRFTLVPTNVSTLPPLINAMEIFYFGDALADGTNKNDVKGLASLQNSFPVLQRWTGDPCLPSSVFTWDWIKCNDDPMPRVTALLLSGYGLSGLIPDFSSMDALQIIDLHNNSLRGPIPVFLGTFPKLKTLNLANNQLNGTIPASLSTKPGLILLVSGNPDLCTSCQILASPPPPRANSSIQKKTNILQLLFSAMIACACILYM